MGSILSETLASGLKSQVAIACVFSARRCVGGGGGFLHGGLPPHPSLEIRLGDGVDHDRHVAVAAAAELGALAAIDARLVGIDLEPGLVDVAGNRVLLDAEVRHPP